MKPINARFGSLILTALALGVSSSANAAPPLELPSIGEAPWEFSAVVYGWLPNAPAGITVNDRTVADLPESLDTILSSMNMAAMFRFDVRKGRLGFFASPVYYDGTYDEKFIGKVTNASRKYEISEQVWLIDYGLSYEVGRWHIGAEPDYGIITLEPYAGFRFFHDRFRLDVDPVPFPTRIGDGVKIAKNVSVNAPIVGLQSEWWLSPNLALHVKGDFGGFGVDKMHKTYQAVSWLAYHFKWGKVDSKVIAGFRYVKLELENDPIAVDVAVRGPLIGFGVDF